MIIKDAVGIRSLFDHFGLSLVRGRMACPIHGGDNPDAFMPTKDDRGYVCNTKGCKGDVIKFVETMNSSSMVEALEWLEQFAGIETSTPTSGPSQAKKSRMKPKNSLEQPSGGTEAPETPKRSPKKVYERTAAVSWTYRDKDGGSVFDVRRFNEVDGAGKICKPFTNGRPGLADESRILYNLDGLTASPEDYVILVEGEKCADAVIKCGFTATTNPMGSGQWKPEYGYGEMLRGREVLVIPDSDSEAEKWVEAIKKDLCGKVKCLQIAPMPGDWVQEHGEFKGHDIADFLQVEGDTKTAALVMDMRTDTKRLPYGVEPGLIVTPNDALAELAEMHQKGDFERIKFNKWITGLNVVAYASDLVVVMAQTGTGKTRILHNIPFHIDNLQYMMFDLELSRGILGLRYASMATGIRTKEILRRIKAGDTPQMRPIDHIHLDNTGNIDIQYIKDRVHLVEDVTQEPIQVVGIDYIGLMKKKGFNSRYGALSEHVESFKGFLNETGRTGIISTQTGRSADKEEGYFQCPSMFAAKDSGSVENSAQLVLRAWRRCPEDRRLLSMNVGKWSHDEPPVEDFELIADGLLVTSEAQYEASRGEEQQPDMF